MLFSGSGVGGADATDDYPIPHRILRTTCTPEQIVAVARDVRPVYYERYMIDYNNKGVAARTTDVCAQHPPDDQSVWNW